jgi:hypothetical protein
MFDLAIHANNFNIGSPLSKQREFAYARICLLLARARHANRCKLALQLPQVRELQGRREFETPELILRGVATYLSDYMNIKQEKKGTGNEVFRRATDTETVDGHLVAVLLRARSVASQLIDQVFNETGQALTSWVVSLNRRTVSARGWSLSPAVSLSAHLQQP